MQKHQNLATLLLRIALAAGFLSAVASRLSLWGSHSSGWKNFLDYTAQVNSFLPKSVIPFLAFVSTALEISLSILLLVGYKTRLAAMFASLLTFLFAVAMAISFGIKEPLDYSVFAVSAAAFYLATASSYQWSVDSLLMVSNNEER